MPRLAARLSTVTLAAVLLLLAATEVTAARSSPTASRGSSLPGPGRERPAPRRTPQALRFAPGEVVVLADQGILDASPDGSPFARDARVGGLLAGLGLTRAHPIARGHATSRSGRERVWVLASDRPGFDPRSASRALQATGAFLAVTPNYRFGLLSTIPNDLYVVFQWYVDDGSFGDIRLPFAWDVARGDSSVVIAIVDTGVDTTHPDLATKIWHNPGEIPGNAVDDDENGFVDDVEGWDFGMEDNDPKPEYTSDASGIDVGFHGTFCAGIAAAATHNDEGIAGAGWDCRIMPLKVSHPDSGISSSALAGAVLYAVDQGASVISMSFGGPGEPGVPEFFQALVDLATQSGAVCVAAAGNDGDSVRVYPAACENVLAVGATDLDNVRATFSNWGPWVDVAAPGSFMWSTIAQNYTLTELDQLIYILLFGWDGLSPYMFGDGTSFACPLTAGVCGLVRARYPSLTPQLVMQHVIATGDDVVYDLPVGRKVNAFQAVTFTPTAVAVNERIPSRARLSAAPNPMLEVGAIRFALSSAGMARLTVYDAAGRRVRALLRERRSSGIHTVEWDGRSDRGERLPSGVYFARLEHEGVVQAAKLVLISR